MSHTHPTKPTQENMKQTEKETNPCLHDLQMIHLQSNLPDIEIIPLPSTSKEPYKNENLKHKPPISLAHIVPLPSSSKDGTIKLIQVSPLKILPKHNVKNLIKLSSNPLPVNLDQFFNEKKTLSNKALQVLGPVKNVPILTSKISRPLIIRKPLGKHVSSHIDLILPSTSSTVSSTNQTKKIQLNTSIPAILQKRAKLHAKNLPSTSNENNTVQQSKIPENHKSEETRINSQKTESKLYIEIQMVSTQDTNTLGKIEKEKEKTEPEGQLKKPYVMKYKFPKKKQREDKDSSSWKNEESMYIADGFRDDVENLIEKCLQGNKLNFEKFCDVWKEMNFPCIFHGRQTSAELAELSEEVIHVAKSYMLARNDNFEENVAGLFLVYALLNHQPYPGFASLRLVPRDVPLILSLEAEARLQKRHDVLYVLGSVLIKGPCQFHVLEREVSIDPALKKYHDGTVQVSSMMDNVCTRNSPCVPLFKKLISLDESYAAVQKQLEKYRDEDKTSQISKRPAADLFQLYQAHIPRGRHGAPTPTELIHKIIPTTKPEEKRADLVKSIKDRAMTNTVESMRHLTGIDERQQDITLSSSEESEVEIKTERKLKFSKKFNSTASDLQKFFACPGPSDDLALMNTSESSQKELPTLDENLEATSNKRTKKVKPLSKRALKKLQKDETNNIKLKKGYKKEKKVKRKLNIRNEISGKEKSPGKCKSLDVLDFSDPKMDDLISPGDRIERDLNISPENDEVNKSTEKSIENTENSFSQKTNNDMPLITIEFERNNEHIQMETENDNKAKREVSNNNTVSKTGTGENLKKALQIEKTELKQISDTSEIRRDNTNIKKKDDEDKKPKKIPKFDKADLKPVDNKKTNNIYSPDKERIKKESSNPPSDLEKYKNLPSPELKSPARRTKSAININVSPKITPNSRKISLAITPRQYQKRENDRELKSEGDIVMRPTKRKRTQDGG